MIESYINDFFFGVVASVSLETGSVRICNKIVLKDSVSHLFC